jgi:hypothetical protein
MQSPGCTRDTAFGQQYLQGDQEVEVDVAHIVYGYAWNLVYSFAL